MIVATSIPEGVEDGFLSLEGGVDSGRDPALLGPTIVADATNVAFRGGLPHPRPGVSKLALTYSGDAESAFSTGRFQGAGGYVSFSGKTYINLSISGKIYSVSLDNLTASPIPFPAGTSQNSPTWRKAWFVQADRYQVIQDGWSGALIWDGASLRRATQDEVPTGGPMAYGLGRLWVGTGRTFVGGDIIYGDPIYGTANVLRFTENQVINEGGSFTVPWQAGDITGMSFAAKTDTASGDGSLMVFTSNGVFEFDAPTDRTAWRDLQQPIQRFALLRNGAESHESIVQVNGDLFFRSIDGIRSFYFARRDWNTWANTPVSREVEPTMSHDDKGLLQWASAVNFDNRLITTADPVMEDRGTVWRKCVSLDFDLVSGISTKLPPAWDGKWILTERILQLLTVQSDTGVRCFAIGFDDDDVISIWELSRNDWKDGTADINWSLQTRSFQFEKPLTLKQLKSSEFWLNELDGAVTIDAYYKADKRECWSPWSRWNESFQLCKSVPNRSLGCLPTLFGKTPIRSRVALPEAPIDPTGQCDGITLPSNMGYEFQVKLEVTGHLKMRKFRILADEKTENEFGDLQNNCVIPTTNECESCG